MKQKEFEQIKISIEIMESINIANAGGEMINKHNVIVLLSKFVEEE